MCCTQQTNISIFCYVVRAGNYEKDSPLAFSPVGSSFPGATWQSFKLTLLPSLQPDPMMEFWSTTLSPNVTSSIITTLFTRHLVPKRHRRPTVADLKVTLSPVVVPGNRMELNLLRKDVSGGSGTHSFLAGGAADTKFRASRHT